MRLDLFLKKTRLVRQRAAAKELCDAGAVSINGRQAKPSQEVRTDDRLLLTLPQRCLDVRVRAIPRGNVARGSTMDYVEILEERQTDRIGSVFESLEPETTARPDSEPKEP